MFAVSPTWLLAICKGVILWLSFNNGFLLATLPQRPDLWSVQLMVVLWTYILPPDLGRVAAVPFLFLDDGCAL